MENKINNYSDIPEKIEFDSKFKEIFNLKFSHFNSNLYLDATFLIEPISPVNNFLPCI